MTLSKLNTSVELNIDSIRSRPFVQTVSCQRTELHRQGQAQDLYKVKFKSTKTHGNKMTVARRNCTTSSGHFKIVACRNMKNCPNRETHLGDHNRSRRSNL